MDNGFRWLASHFQGLWGPKAAVTISRSAQNVNLKSKVAGALWDTAIWFNLKAES